MNLGSRLSTPVSTSRRGGAVADAGNAAMAALDRVPLPPAELLLRMAVAVAF